MSTVFYGWQVTGGASAQLILPRVRARVAKHLESPSARFADGALRPVAPIMVRVFLHAPYGDYLEPRARYDWMIDGAFVDPYLTPAFVDTRSEPATLRQRAVVDAIDGMIIARQFFLYSLIDLDDLRLAGLFEAVDA